MIMKTYEQETTDGIRYRWFYDPYIKSWTIYQIDKEGNQIDDADYHHSRPILKQCYPELKF